MAGCWALTQKPLYWLPELLSFFACTRQYGVLDRIANAIGAEQALAALYDALRTYHSSCLGPSPDPNCRSIEIKTKEGEEARVSPRELMERANREVDHIAKLLLDPATVEDGLKLARMAALSALGKKCSAQEEPAST